MPKNEQKPSSWRGYQELFSLTTTSANDVTPIKRWLLSNALVRFLEFAIFKLPETDPGVKNSHAPRWEAVYGNLQDNIEVVELDPDDIDDWTSLSRLDFYSRFVYHVRDIIRAGQDKYNLPSFPTNDEEEQAKIVYDFANFLSSQFGKRQSFSDPQARFGKLMRMFLDSKQLQAHRNDELTVPIAFVWTPPWLGTREGFPTTTTEKEADAEVEVRLSFYASPATKMKQKQVNPMRRKFSTDDTIKPDDEPNTLGGQYKTDGSFIERTDEERQALVEIIKNMRGLNEVGGRYRVKPYIHEKDQRRRRNYNYIDEEEQEDPADSVESAALAEDIANERRMLEPIHSRVTNFNRVQKWLDDPEFQFPEYDEALSIIRRVLQLGHLSLEEEEISILHRLPTPRNRVGREMDEQNRPLGQKHLPHQVCWLAWALLNAKVYGGGINADGCGMGKTTELLMLLIAMRRHATLLGEKPRPSMVIVPSHLEEKWYFTLRNELGQDFRVTRYLKVSGKRDDTVFSPAHAIYSDSNGKDPSRNILLITYSMIQRVKPREELDGLFAGIYCDEAHAIKNLLDTKQGMALVAFNADYRWCFTATVVCNSIADLFGYLQFLERPAWLEDCRGTNSKVMAWLESQGFQSLPESKAEAKMMAGFAGVSSDVTSKSSWEVKNHGKNSVKDSDCSLSSSRILPPFFSSTSELFADDGTVSSARTSQLSKSNSSSHKAISVGLSMPCSTMSRASSRRRQWRRIRSKGQRCRTHFPKNVIIARCASPTDSILYRPQRRSSRRGVPENARWPFNPFNEFHKADPDHRKCLTSRAWRAYCNPYVQGRSGETTEQEDQRLRILGNRVRKIFKALVICRNAHSTVTVYDVSELCGQNFPKMKWSTQDLCLTAEEQSVYDDREASFGKKDIESMLKKLQKLDTDPVEHRESTFRQLFTLTTHLSSWVIRGKDIFEMDISIAALVKLFREKSALPQRLLDVDPWTSDELLLHQYLFGAPKLRYLVYQIMKICNRLDQRKKKVICWFMFPMSMFLAQKVGPNI